MVKMNKKCPDEFTLFLPLLENICGSILSHWMLKF